MPHPNPGAAADRLPVPAGPDAGIILCDGDTDHITRGRDGTILWDAPVGDRVLFALPLPEGARFEDFDICKFDIKLDGGPVDVMVFLERPGKKRRIYRPIDINMPERGWRTIRLDIHCPEIVRESHFKAESPRIAFNFWAMDTGYPAQEPVRRIAVRNVRLAKRLIEVDWNGCDYRIVPDASGDLVLEYPLTVRNTGDEAYRVSGRLEKKEGYYGRGRLAPSSFSLSPGDSVVCRAVLRLPAGRLKDLPPFYCEWFLPVFSIEGVPDSDDVILRSSDEIALPLMILPDIRNPVLLFDADGMERMLERYGNTPWGRKEGAGIIARAEEILSGDLTIPDGPGWARAYYYCPEHRCVLRYEGPGRHYCPVGGEYRKVDFMGVSLDRDYRAGEHNRVAGWTRTLALAYALTGDSRFSEGALDIIRQYRNAYFTYDWLDLDASTETIDRGRLHFAKYMETYPFRAMMEALDILKATGGIAPGEAEDIDRNLILPALVEITDYRMGMLGRQTTISTTALIGGLYLYHAPLVAFAVRSPFGYFSLRRWGATADGICHGHGYAQLSATLHLLEMAELLYRFGVDTFDHELKRLVDGSFLWSVPMNPERMGRIFSIAARHYPDPVYRRYARRSLVDGEPPPYAGGGIDPALCPSVNFPNSGLTILRRRSPAMGTIETEFKWSMPDNRGSFSVLSLGMYFNGYRCQSYPGHFHWGSTDLHHNWQIQSASHTTIVVDRHNHSGMKDYFKGHYMPHLSEQLFYEDGPDAAVTVAYNDRIYPGVGIWRAVCVLDGAVLVIDMLRSGEEHTYDWWFHGVPDHSNGREGLTVRLRPRNEPVGEEDGYEMVRGLSSAVVEADFGADWRIPGNEGRGGFNLSMRVLNDSPVEVIHGFEWSHQYAKPEKEFLLLRREAARDAEFIVLFEPNDEGSRLSRFERFTVTDGSGRPLRDCIGLNVEIGGKSMEIVFNPLKARIRTAGGMTGEIFRVCPMP